MVNKPVLLLLVIFATTLLTGCGSPSDETALPAESSSQTTDTQERDPIQSESLPDDIVDEKPTDDTVHTDPPDISDLE